MKIFFETTKPAFRMAPGRPPFLVSLTFGCELGRPLGRIGDRAQTK